MKDTVRIGVVGIDHRHIYTMAGHLIDQGAHLVAFATDGDPGTLPGWQKRFPDAPRWQEDDIISAPDIDLVLTAGVPSDRASVACRAMEAGKDVLSDKPGCLTIRDLETLRETATRTGRIWSVDFSERFEVPGVTLASELVAAGEIGRVVHTLGIGPHRLNAATRPDWFWKREQNGGILADIGAHQIDQFLHFTGSEDAMVVHASAHCIAREGFQDVGQMTLQSGDATGYVKLDWFTPDAMPTWGDGRLFLTGTEGTIEIRKYADVGGQPGGDHVFLTNGTRSERFDASNAGLPFFGRLLEDVLNRSETAHSRAHPFTVMRLAIEAQEMAEAC